MCTGMDFKLFLMIVYSQEKVLNPFNEKVNLLGGVEA